MKYAYATKEGQGFCFEIGDDYSKFIPLIKEAGYLFYDISNSKDAVYRFHKVDIFVSYPDFSNFINLSAQKEEQVIISLGLYNPLGVKPNSTDIMKAVDIIVNPIGWDTDQVSTSQNNITLTFVKRGSPVVIPIAAICLAIIAVMVGVVVISISLTTIRVSEEATKQMQEKTAQLKTMEDLIEQGRQDVQEGLIDEATFESIYLSAIGATTDIAGQEITPSPAGWGNWGGDMMGMVNIAVPAVLLIALLGVIKK